MYTEFYGCVMCDPSANMSLMRLKWCAFLSLEKLIYINPKMKLKNAQKIEKTIIRKKATQWRTTECTVRYWCWTITLRLCTFFPSLLWRVFSKKKKTRNTTYNMEIRRNRPMFWQKNLCILSAILLVKMIIQSLVGVCTGSLVPIGWYSSRCR